MRLAKKAQDMKRKDAMGSLQRRKNYDKEVKRGIKKSLYNIKPAIDVRLSLNLRKSKQGLPRINIARRQLPAV